MPEAPTVATTAPRAAALFARYREVNITLLDQALVSGCNFLTSAVMARKLGLSEFGVYTLAWLIPLFASNLQFSGAIAPMLSIGPKQNAADQPSYYGAVLVQQLGFVVAFAGIAALGVALYNFLIPGTFPPGVAPAVVGASSAFLVHDFLRRYFFVRGKPIRAFVIDVLGYAGQLGAIIALARFSAVTASTCLWAVTASLTLAILVAIPLQSSLSVEFSKESIRKLWGRHWPTARWLVASSLLQWTTGNYLTIAASSLLGTWAAGTLKTSQNVMGVTHIFFLGLENYLPVRAAARYQAHGRQALNDYLKRVALIGGGLTALVALVIAVGAESLLGLLYGEAVRSQAPVLRSFAMLYVLIYLNLPLRIGLRTIERTRAIFIGYAVSSVVTLASAVTLVRYLGIQGVLIGLFLSQVSLSGACLWGLRAKEAGDP